MAFFWHFTFHMNTIGSTIRKIPWELVFWIGAIIGIFLIDPYGPHHFSLCPLDNLGVTWCPGCGLGRSMSLLSKGDFKASWSMHPLAMFAFATISYRIIQLIRNLNIIKNHG